MKGDTDSPILKRDIEWLWKAINTGLKQFINIGDEGAIALDGFRFHQIGNLPEDVDSIRTEEITDIIDNGTVTASFLVNPKFLLDALSGFVLSINGKVEISLVKHEKSDTWGILVHEPGCDNKRAFVMCIQRSK